MRNLRYFKILTFSGYVSQNSRTATTESLNVFINSVKNSFDKNHRLLKSEIFSVGIRINWITVSYQFDKHGNVIEEIIYNKDGVWKSKKTYQYEYYE